MARPWPRRSAACTATWPRPTRAGDRASAAPRQPIEPRSDRVVLHLLKESRPQRQNGFTMRSHDNLLAQRAAGWDPVVVTALGFPRSDRRARSRRSRRSTASAITDSTSAPAIRSMARSTLYLEDYAWRAAAVARDERPAIIHASSGGRGYETALVGLALGEHLDLPVVYEVRSLFDGPAPAARRPGPRPTPPRRANAIDAATRPRCARCSPRTPS